MPSDSTSHSSRIDLIATAYTRHHAALLGYVYDRLEVSDHHVGQDIAADVWLRITESADRVDQRVLDLTWLQMIARAVLREQTSPTRHQVLYVMPERLTARESTVPAAPTALIAA